jgi:asparagine synthase (glutamine-hydrolysing)
MFNEKFLREMVDQHIAGSKDYSAPLWSVLMFETFLRVSAKA